MASWRPAIDAPVTYDYHGYTRGQVRARGARGPSSCTTLALLKDVDLAGHGPAGRRIRPSVTEAINSPSPIARPITAIRSSSTYRWRNCCRTTTTRAPRTDWRARLPRAAARPAFQASRARSDRVPDMLSRLTKSARSAWTTEPTRPTAASLRSSAATPAHLDIIDRWGNMISATPSGGWLQ